MASSDVWAFGRIEGEVGEEALVEKGAEPVVVLDCDRRIEVRRKVGVRQVVDGVVGWDANLLDFGVRFERRRMRSRRESRGSHYGGICVRQSSLSRVSYLSTLPPTVRERGVRSTKSGDLRKDRELIPQRFIREGYLTWPIRRVEEVH